LLAKTYWKEKLDADKALVVLKKGLQKCEDEGDDGEDFILAL